MANVRFSSRSRSNKITIRRYIALTFTNYTTIMIVELAVISGLRSSLE
jgi:hypothetical protein